MSVPSASLSSSFAKAVHVRVAFRLRCSASSRWRALMRARRAVSSQATRALADLCLVLFNSNEFVYVY